MRLPTKMDDGQDDVRKADAKDVAKGLDIEEGLTDWEVNFLESLHSWTKQKPLSDNQRAKLDALLRHHDR